MSLCRFVVANGGQAALVLCCSDCESELEHMSGYFGAAIAGNRIAVNGVDVFAGEPANALDDYNLVVYDCGDINLKSNSDKVERFGVSDKTDAIFLCCGIGWKELHHVTKSHEKLNGLRYIAVVNADESACEAHHEVLCGNLNGHAAVDFRDCSGVGAVVYGNA
jgi:hypothetical protein